MTEERIARIEKKVERLDRIAWLLGALAIIFGLGGAFGYKLLSSAGDRLDMTNAAIRDTEERVSKTEQDISSVENRLEEVFSAQEMALEAFVSEQKAALDAHASELSANLLDSMVQSGVGSVGQSRRDPTKRATVTFNSPFAKLPRVVAVPLGSDHPDTFSVTVIRITKEEFTVQVHRVDGGDRRWSQELKLFWVAVAETE